MKAGKVNAVVVGADRVAAIGDTANKIGTYSLAVLAKHHDIPFLCGCTFHFHRFVYVFWGRSRDRRKVTKINTSCSRRTGRTSCCFWNLCLESCLRCYTSYYHHRHFYRKGSHHQKWD